MNSTLFEAFTFLSFGLELIPGYPGIITRILALITGLILVFHI